MISKKLAELGIVVPKLVPPLASYVPARKSGNLIYISGQLPMKDGQLMMTGRMSPERSLEEVQAALAQSFLNGLAAASTVVELDELKEVIRLGVLVASTPEFTDQHKVANGASDLAKKIFGDQGIHARAAYGTPSLPLGATVELEILFQI